MRLFIALVFCSVTAFSQYSVSAFTGYSHFFGETGIKNVSGGLRLEYVTNDVVGLYAGLSFMSKSNYNAKVIVQSRSDFFRPQVTDVPAPSAASFTQMFAGGRFYFRGSLDGGIQEDIGVYAIGEVGLLTGKVSSEVDATDFILNYEVPVQGLVENSFVNYYLGIGAAVEKPVKSVFLFFETKINVRINEANVYEVTTDIPLGMSYIIGIRIPFGET